MASVLTTPDQQTAPTGRRRPRLRWLLAALGLLLILAAGAVGLMAMRMSQSIPADLDLATTRLSGQGLYRATITPRLDPIKINQVHSWTLHLETPDGRPVQGATITVDGDMPGHGHGLPTRPQVTRALGNGDYLVEGMKFQMTGWWYVEFDITAGGQHDSVRFNLVVK